MILSLEKMTILSIVVILVSVTVIWGLETLTCSEVFNPVEVETTYGPIKLTMKLNKTSYRLGESVTITLTVTNLSNETVLLGFCVLCKTNFVVCDKSSQIIFSYYSSRGWPESGGEVILDSRESFSQALIWSQLEIDKFSPYASRQVQPGNYYIKGQVGPDLIYVGSPDEFNPREASLIKIETSEIEIEIA